MKKPTNLERKALHMTRASRSVFRVFGCEETERERWLGLFGQNSFFDKWVDLPLG